MGRSRSFVLYVTCVHVPLGLLRVEENSKSTPPVYYTFDDFRFGLSLRANSKCKTAQLWMMMMERLCVVKSTAPPRGRAAGCNFTSRTDTGKSDGEERSTGNEQSKYGGMKTSIGLMRYNNAEAENLDIMGWKWEYKYLSVHTQQQRVYLPGSRFFFHWHLRLRVKFLEEYFLYAQMRCVFEHRKFIFVLGDGFFHISSGYALYIYTYFSSICPVSFFSSVIVYRGHCPV